MSMEWISFEEGKHPPENVDIVIQLRSSIVLMGRNLEGCFCTYSAETDRFVEYLSFTDGRRKPWYSRYFVIDKTPPALPPSDNLSLF